MLRTGPGAGDDFEKANNGEFDCAGTSASKAGQEFLSIPWMEARRASAITTIGSAPWTR